MTPISRRAFCVSLLAATACGASTPAAAVEIPNLEQTLRTGLKPRSPQQEAFLRLVVLRVKEGVLPLELVRKAFLWARKKDGPYAFSYFEHGLRRLARQERIPL